MAIRGTCAIINQNVDIISALCYFNTISIKLWIITFFLYIAKTNVAYFHSPTSQYIQYF